jgi:DNA-binding NtrC family response regulator
MATILLVEDCDSSRRALGRLLEMDGHRVIATENGWQGLGAMESGDVDLVVLDLKLPGMDGVHFLKDKGWEERWHGVPVIVMSGQEKDNRVWKDHGQRIKGWIEKGGVGGEELLEVVRRNLVGVN